MTGGQQSIFHWLKWPIAMLLGMGCLYLVFNIYLAGQAFYAIGFLILASIGFYIYLSNAAFAYRYLFPGLAGMAIFVAFPLFYTVQIGLTNYSSSNLLSLNVPKVICLNKPRRMKIVHWVIHCMLKAMNFVSS